MNGYKHFIRKDANNNVIDGYADWETDKRNADEIQISGIMGRHFTFNLYTDRRQFKYKIVNGQMVERTQEELDTEWAARPTPPKTAEQKKIDQLEAQLAQQNADVTAFMDFYFESIGE